MAINECPKWTGSEGNDSILMKVDSYCYMQGLCEEHGEENQAKVCDDPQCICECCVGSRNDYRIDRIV